MLVALFQVENSSVDSNIEFSSHSVHSSAALGMGSDLHAFEQSQ